MVVAGNMEVHSSRGNECQRLGDKTAVHRQLSGAVVIGGFRAGVELQSAQVDSIVPPETIDRRV